MVTQVRGSLNDDKLVVPLANRIGQMPEQICSPRPVTAEFLGYGIYDTVARDARRTRFHEKRVPMENIRILQAFLEKQFGSHVVPANNWKNSSALSPGKSQLTQGQRMPLAKTENAGLRQT